ncbi:MAG: flagellar biosynthetic protein FliR [Pseudomonadota bacterium]
MIHFTEAQLTALVGSYLWPFFRIAALATAMPFIGARTVPARVRLSFALALTVIIAPLVPQVPAVSPLSPAGVVIVIQQVLIGLAMGFALQLVFSVFVIGAQIISMQMGLGFASMIDPQSGASVPVVGQFFMILATLIFLALDGHLVLIEILVDSFQTLPISESGLGANGYWQIVAWGSEMFASAVMVALPAMAALLLVNLSFGVMTRAAPQLNIFAVGFPITIILGFVILYFTLPGMIAMMESMFSINLDMIARLVGG